MHPFHLTHSFKNKKKASIPFLLASWSTALLYYLLLLYYSFVYPSPFHSFKMASDSRDLKLYTEPTKMSYNVCFQECLFTEVG